MTTRRRFATVALVLALAATPMAACGRGEQPGGQPSTAPTSAPVSTAPTSVTPSAPGTSAPAPTPTTPGQVTSARVAYAWGWPNDVERPGAVSHTRTVAPQSVLIRIGVGDHPRDPGERPFNRMSFTFTGGFPSYRFEFTDRLISDGRGEVVPVRGSGVLRIVFTDARAHNDAGRSTITAQPGRDFNLRRMVDYAGAGDFEGHVTYGIGIFWPIPHSNPQIDVRAYEVHRITPSGRHEYVVAFDVDAR